MLLAIFAALLSTAKASAHFPWLVVTKEGKAAYFFGETPAERTYKLPPSIAKAEVRRSDDKSGAPIEMVKVENDQFIGLESAAPVDAQASLVSRVTYGIYQGSRLDYYSLHHGGPLPKSAPAPAKDDSPRKLDAYLVDTDAGVDLYLLWNGKPLAGAEARLFCEDGHEEGAAKTDESGKASFTDAEVEDGINGIMVGHTVKDDSGEIDGKPYKSSAHYLTITFVKP
jgi:hypothetical protein